MQRVGAPRSTALNRNKLRIASLENRVSLIIEISCNRERDRKPREMAGGTGEAQSRPAMDSPTAFFESTCSCLELAVRGVWGCLAYHLGFGGDCADYGCKKDEGEEEEIKSRKREEHEEEDETESRKKEAEHEEEDDRIGTRKREEDEEEEEEARTKENGGREINLGVTLREDPKGQDLIREVVGK